MGRNNFLYQIARSKYLEGKRLSTCYKTFASNLTVAPSLLFGYTYNKSLQPKLIFPLLH